MPFFTGYTSKYVYNEIQLQADSKTVWHEITNVMVTHFRFPMLFRILGIPKPLSAQVIREGVGGYRVADFSNGAQFRQEILAWDEYENYRFRFNPTSDFEVGHVMNLAKGPFEIQTGGYELHADKHTLKLVLSSNYTLHGFWGKVMHIPFRLVVYHFQKYLLKGIKANLCTKQNH